MRHIPSLVAALCALTFSVTGSAEDHSACRQALQSLSSAASSASFEASRAESDCRDADTSCASYRSCGIAGGDVSAACQAQRIACESASQRCSAAESSLDNSLSNVRSAISSAQVSCR